MVKYYDPYYTSEVDLQAEIDKLLNLARKKGYQYNRSKYRRDMNRIAEMNIKDYKRGELSEDVKTKALLKILRDLEMQMFGELRYKTPEEKEEIEYFEDMLNYPEDRKKRTAKPKPKRKVVKKCKCK